MHNNLVDILTLNNLAIPKENFFFINGMNIKDKQSFLMEFSRELQFPDYFGFNWDAFFDCMKDLSWLNTESGLVICYENPENFRKHNSEDWEVANDILLSLIPYWRSFNINFIIVFC
jgi:RNAse (barnase) inhibitor barstar